MRALAVIVVLVLAAARCAVDPGIHAATLGADVVLAMGKRAVFNPGGLEVRFVSIVEDSRCPADATCIWAGRVVARLAIHDASRPTADYDVVAGEGATVQGFQVRIEKVSPVRTSKKKVAQRDYRVTVRVEPHG